MQWSSANVANLVAALMVVASVGIMWWEDAGAFPRVKRLDGSTLLVAFDPEFLTLFDFQPQGTSGAKVEVLGSDFSFTDGALWREASGESGSSGLLFSDSAENSIYEWSPETRASTVVVYPAGASTPGLLSHPGTSGLTLEPGTGKLIVCDQGNRQIARIESDGSRTILASHFRGSRLNSPNDAVFSKHGHLYFTDPSYGLIHLDGPRMGETSPDRELDFNGVYVVFNATSIAPGDNDQASARARVHLLVSSLERPNGIALSSSPSSLTSSSSSSTTTTATTATTTETTSPPPPPSSSSSPSLAREGGVSRGTDHGSLPAEHTLYLSNSHYSDMHWRAYAVKNNGELGPGRVFARIDSVYAQHESAGEKLIGRDGNADGLVVDRDGRLWATAPGGIVVWNRTGRHIGTVALAKSPTSLAFDPSSQWLYITTKSGLLRVKTSIANGDKGGGSSSSTTTRKTAAPLATGASPSHSS